MQFNTPEEPSIEMEAFQVSPKQNIHQFLQMKRQKVHTSSDEFVNVQYSSDRKQSNKVNQMAVGLQGTWRHRGFRILYIISRFILALRHPPDFHKLKQITPHVYSIINDKSADFDYFQLKGFFRIGQKNSQHNHLIEEQLQQHRISLQIGVLKPESFLKIVWDVLLLIVTSACLCFIPMRLAFPVTHHRQYILDFYQTVFGFIPWIVFILDMAVSFNTAYYFKGSLHIDRREITKHYIEGNLLRDLLTIFFFPLSTIYEELSILVWILKVGQVPLLVKNLESTTSLRQRHTVIWDLSKLIFFLVFMCHNFACTWRYIALIEEKNSIENTWLIAKNIEDSSWVTQYIYSFYWSTITLTTIGYGDIYAQNEYEMVFIVFMVPMTSILFGYAISSIQSIFAQLKERSDKYNYQMGIINRYIKSNKLDHQLSMRVRNYFDCFLNSLHNESEEGEKLIESLNEDLKLEVKEQVYMKILERSDLLTTNFDTELIKLLCQEVKFQKYLPGDTLMVKGQNVDNLYFILSGEVQLFIPKEHDQSHGKTSDRLLIKVYKDEVLGERNFIQQAQIEFSARTQEFTEVACLKYSDFIKVIRKVPGQYEKFALLRDNLQFNKNFKGMSKTCQICTFSHTFDKCPFVFMQIDKTKLISQIQHDLTVQPRLRFYRQRRKSYGFRRARQNIQLQAIGLAVEEDEIKESELNNELLNILGLFSEDKSRNANDSIIEEEDEEENSDSSDFSQHSQLDERTQERIDDRQRKLSDKVFYSNLISNSGLQQRKGLGPKKLSQYALRQSVVHRPSNSRLSHQRNSRQGSKQFDQSDNRLMELILKNEQDNPRSLTDAAIDRSQLEFLKDEFMKLIKGDDIEGFEGRNDFKYFYPSKNLNQLIGRRSRDQHHKPKKMMTDLIKHKMSKQ